MDELNRYTSIRNASKALNIDDACISECANNGKQKTAGGYIFKFVGWETPENIIKYKKNIITKKK